MPTSSKYTAMYCLLRKQNWTHVDLNACKSSHKDQAPWPCLFRSPKLDINPHPPLKCCQPKSSSLTLPGRTPPPWTMIALIHPKPLASCVRALWMPVYFPSGLKHHQLSPNLLLPRHIQAPHRECHAGLQVLKDFWTLETLPTLLSAWSVLSPPGIPHFWLLSVQLQSMSKFLKTLLASHKHILLAFLRLSISAFLVSGGIL